MRVVVVGDLAWKGRYHLGDEAMSEVALTQLRDRGAEVTFIAGEPKICSDFYGVDAAPRFGFGSIKTRAAKDAHIDAIVAAVDDPERCPAGSEQTLAALRKADSVVIAGGGNLNSIGIHHIYERLAVKRVSEKLSVPLYVTSQTVGPHLRESERELVAEIAAYATVFGVRERTSAELMRSLCGDRARIVHTLDDAMLLEPAELPGPAALGLELPQRYAIGSFTFHARTTSLDEETYYRELAAILDDVVERLETDVILLPHMSTFQKPNTLGRDDDGYGHDRIASLSRTHRVRSASLLPARELLAVTAGASFSISTRYHPLIFGAALGVPAVGIVHSYYSAVRMRGALANVGMEEFAIPFEYWRPVLGAPLVDALVARLDDYTEHIARVGADQRAYQSRWWDGLYASMSGTGDPLAEDRPSPPVIAWTDERMRDLLTMSRVAQEMVNLDRLNAQIDEEQRGEQRTKIRALERRTLHVEERVSESEARVSRELGEIRHRMRPPGADLRDKIRLRLRGRRPSQ